VSLTPEEQKQQDQMDFYYAWAWLLGVIALGAVVALIYYSTEPANRLRVFATFGETVAVVCWFIYAFTGDPYRKRTNAVILSYFFVIVSLLLFTVPTFVSGKSIGGEPIGIVSGCVLMTEAKELLCKTPETPPAQTSAAAEGKAPPKPQGAAKAPSGSKAGESQKTRGAEQPQNNQWLINIGGVTRPQETISSTSGNVCGQGLPCGTNLYVSGGIAVPLYFVILALIGGAISLSRRVPEIQKRSENNYVGTPNEPKLQPEEVRESLAFQVLQFISAPLIAVTAYQVIRPDGMAASAALAFACGFGSETILLMIRGVANGLKPQSLTPASTGIASGTVTESGNKLVPNAQVSVAGTALKSKADEKGAYTIREVPVGEREIVATEGTRSGKVRVSVQAGQTVTGNIELK
jgi:carboxypeptidase family protein